MFLNPVWIQFGLKPTSVCRESRGTSTRPSTSVNQNVTITSVCRESRGTSTRPNTSANQSVTIPFPHESPGHWRPCFHHELKNRNDALLNDALLNAQCCFAQRCLLNDALLNDALLNAQCCFAQPALLNDALGKPERTAHD